MTKLLPIGLLLLSCGVVEAAEPNPTLWRWYGDPQLGMTFISPCEQRMKAVMREVDGILRFNYESLDAREPGQARVSLNLPRWLYRWWADVMKECIQ